MTRRSRLNPATTTGDVVPTLAVNPASARAAIDAARSKVQITDNCYCVPAGTGTFSGTFRWFYKVGISACDIQLVFGNWQSAVVNPQIDVDASTTLTFKASVRDAAGNNYPVTFGGVLTATLGPGPGPLVSDPVHIEVAKGDQIAVLVYTASGTYQVTRVYAGFSGGGGVSAGDLTAKGASAVADVNTGVGAGGPSPIAIIGTPIDSGIPKALVQYGDSICWGTDIGYQLLIGYFPAMPYVSGGGFVHRAVTGEAGFIQGGINFDRLYWFNAGYGHFRRGVALKYCRYAFVEYGHNDLFDGKTPVQIQTDLLTCCTRNRARGIIKNIIMTLIPHTGSTDGWSTTAGQTTQPSPPFETDRVAHNTWVRDGGPIDPTTLAPVAAGTVGALRFGQGVHPIGAYLEVADVVESGRNSGKWKAMGRRVTDAVSNATTTITSATANFTIADVGATVFFPGAAASGADYGGTIKSVTNSTTAVLFTATATSVSGGGLVIGGLTADGIHPWVTGHTYIAAAIQAPLLALLN